MRTCRTRYNHENELYLRHIWKSNGFLFRWVKSSYFSAKQNIMLLSCRPVLTCADAASFVAIFAGGTQTSVVFPSESIGAQPLPQLWQNKYTINIFCYGTVAYSGLISQTWMWEKQTTTLVFMNNSPTFDMQNVTNEMHKLWILPNVLLFLCLFNNHTSYQICHGLVKRL